VILFYAGILALEKWSPFYIGLLTYVSTPSPLLASAEICLVPLL